MDLPGIQPAELVLRTAAVLGCLLFAGLSAFIRRDDHTHWMGVLYCAGVIGFVITSAGGAVSMPGVMYYVLTLLCVTKAAWFWLFSRGLFSGEFRMGTSTLVLAGVVGAYGTWQQLIFMPAAKAGPVSAMAQAASLGFEAVVIVLVLLALREAYRGLTADLVERRRRLRLAFVVAVAGYLCIAVAVQICNQLLGVRTPAPLVLANLALIAGASLLASLSLVQMRSSHWLAPERWGAQGGISPAEERILAALNHALESERIYREEGLTIGRLAERLGTREHVLRNVINQGLGFRNFNDFLHAYRIREACRRLQRPEEADLPVLSIALDVGYSSIGPFNRAFKSRIGMTPSSFRRRASGATQTA